MEIQIIKALTVIIETTIIETAILITVAVTIIILSHSNLKVNHTSVLF
jgi:hypothetical protein